MNSLWTVKPDGQIETLDSDGSTGRLPFRFGQSVDPAAFKEELENWDRISILLSSRWFYWVKVDSPETGNNEKNLSYLLEETLPFDAENIHFSSDPKVFDGSLLAVEANPLKRLLDELESLELEIAGIGSESIESVLRLPDLNKKKNGSFLLFHKSHQEKLHIQNHRLTRWTIEYKDNLQESADEFLSENPEGKIWCLENSLSDQVSISDNNRIAEETAELLIKKISADAFRDRLICNLATGVLESKKRALQWQAAYQLLMLSIIIGFLLLGVSFLFAASKERQTAESELENATTKIRRIEKKLPRRRPKRWLDREIKNQESLLRQAKSIALEESCLLTLKQFTEAYLSQFPTRNPKNELKSLEIGPQSFKADGNFPNMDQFWKEAKLAGFSDPSRRLTTSWKGVVVGNREAKVDKK